MAPTWGERDQVTAVFEAPLTVAVNCMGGDVVVRLALDGFRARETVGLRVTVTLAVLAVSATLVAVTVTVCWERTLEGAVYNPDAEMEPI